MFEREEKALLWRHGHEIVRIEPWGRDSLRVRATRNSAIRDDLPAALLPAAEQSPTIRIEKDCAVIQNGAIEAHVVDKGGRISFHRAEDGDLLLEEVFFHPHAPSLRPAPRDYWPTGGDLYRIEASFSAFDDERFYGLGQHRHGCLDQKGCVIDLAQRNAEVCIPFAISNRMYGFLWNNPSIGRVELGKTQTRWVAEGARQIDYWVTAGETYADIMARYADATGHAPMIPHWATGFWQSKLRYRNQEEFMGIAREFKKRGLPLSLLVIDYFHWTSMGDWQFDSKQWPNPAAMVRELEAQGVKTVVSVWPSVNPNSINAATMNEQGFLARTERGTAMLSNLPDTKDRGRVFVHYYDPFNPKAREFVWSKVRDNYYRHGIKVYWLDGCEPKLTPVHHENVRYFAGPAVEVGNLYPMMNLQAFYDGMKAEGETEILFLTRSAWAGSQRYGAAVWNGDIESNFEMLRASVNAGLNIMMSGIPWWTTDIGGFMGGNVNDPSFRELLVRWFQYSAFCPLFRLHGHRLPAPEKQDDGLATGAANEPWSFGEENYEIIKKLLLLRERMRPYIEEQLKVAHETGLPPMRPLFFDFPDDAICYEAEYQYLFGPDVLVAPVVHEGARERRVYLPDGATWRDAWSDAKYEGGQWIEAEAPLDCIPVYFRNEARPFEAS